MVLNSNIRPVSSLYYVISFYFSISAIIGFFQMLGFPIIGKMHILYRVCLICLSIYCLKTRCSQIDRFIISFVFILVLSSFFAEGFSDLLYNAIRSQIVMMFFFFVGESTFGADDRLILRSILPILMVGLCGLILYIYSPSWYIQWKLEGIENYASALEFLRLSAFWKWPYWISYGCCIIYCYILSESFRFRCLSLKLFSILIFLIAIMILAQQRAPLFFSVFVTLLFVVLGLMKRRSAPTFKLYLLLFVGLIIGGIVLLLNFIDVDMLESLYMKLDNASEGSAFLKNRANLYSEFYTKPITLFGDGLGFYSLLDADDGRLIITDHQYLKFLYENGIVGLCGYILIFIASLVVGFRNLKYNLFEISIMVMYLIAMSGANCLMVEGEHPAIFWFCCGRLFNKQCLKNKKIGINPLNKYI